MNISRKGGNLVLDKVDFDRAHDVLVRTEDKMFYTFRGVGKSDISDIVSNVMTTIAIRKTITFSTLLSLHYNDADKDVMKRVIDTLQAMKYCRVVQNNKEIIIEYNEGGD